MAGGCGFGRSMGSADRGYDRIRGSVEGSRVPGSRVPPESQRSQGVSGSASALIGPSSGIKIKPKIFLFLWIVCQFCRVVISKKASSSEQKSRHRSRKISNCQTLSSNWTGRWTRKMAGNVSLIAMWTSCHQVKSRQIYSINPIFCFRFTIFHSNSFFYFCEVFYSFSFGSIYIIT